MNTHESILMHLGSTAISFKQSNNNPFIELYSDKYNDRANMHHSESIRKIYMDLNFLNLWELDHEIGNKHSSLILHTRMPHLKDGTDAPKWHDGHYPCLFQMNTGGSNWRIMIFSADHPPKMDKNWHAIFHYNSVLVDINMNPISGHTWTANSKRAKGIIGETHEFPSETIDYQNHIITFMANAGTDNMFGEHYKTHDFINYVLTPQFTCKVNHQIAILRWTSAYDNRLLLTGETNISSTNTSHVQVENLNLHSWLLLNWRSKQIINGYAVNYSWGSPSYSGSPAGFGMSFATYDGSNVGSWPHSQNAFFAFETPGPYTLSIDFDNTKNNNGNGTLSASGIEGDCGTSSQGHINGSYNASSTIGSNESKTIHFYDHRPHGGTDSNSAIDNAWILTDERLPAERYNLFFDNDSFNASGADTHNASSTYKVEVVNGCFFDDPATFNGSTSYSFTNSSMTVLSTSYTEADLMQQNGNGAIYWTPSIRNYIRINFLKMLENGESAYDITPKIKITYHEYSFKVIMDDECECGGTLNLGGQSVSFSTGSHIFHHVTGPTISWSVSEYGGEMHDEVVLNNGTNTFDDDGLLHSGIIHITDLRVEAEPGVCLASITITQKS